MFKLSTLHHRWFGRTGNGQRGVTLLELTVILAALTALAIGLSYKTTDYFNKTQVLDSDALLRMADNQLRQYIALNGRLPCPDLNADGIADDDGSGNCSDQQKGYLPYVTLGLADKSYGYGEVPILYGVYRDGTISFTSHLQTFFPAYQDKTNAPIKVINDRNTYDFCASLEALQALGTATGSGLNVPTAGIAYNAVYALALPGQANRDGLPAGSAANAAWTATINAQYDGLNASSVNQFESPQAPVSPTYDDRTFFRSATDLHDYFRCEALNNSVSLLTQAVTVQKETEDFADANSENVTNGLILNAVTIALAAWQLGTSIAAAAEAAETLGISSGLLAGVTATCPIPPWVTCALIPVYAVAVTSASVGLGLSVGASVAAGVQLGLSITATVLYADLKSRTSTTPTDPAPPNAGITGDRLTTLKSTYATSKGKAQTAFNAIPGAPGQTVAQLNSAQKSAASTVAADIAAISDGTLRTALGNYLNGVSSTCDPAAHPGFPTWCLDNGFTARDVPLANPGNSFTKVNSTDGAILICVDTPDNCLAGGYTQNQKTIVWTKINTDPAAGTLGATLTCDPVAHPDPYCENNGFTASGTDIMTKIYTKDGLVAPYSPGVIPALDAYYQGQTPTVNADGTTTPPAGSNLNASNAVTSAYSALLAAIADFDAKNQAYLTSLAATSAAFQAWVAAGQPGSGFWFNALSPAEQNWVSFGKPVSGIWYLELPTVDQGYIVSGTARNTSLSTLQGLLGNPSWNYTGSASVCGASGCGWMTGGAASAGNASTPATTGSSVLNNYLIAYENYRNSDAYKAAQSAADSAATSAWSDRNSFKSALCAVEYPTAKTWMGGGTPSALNPASWDSLENLPGATWTPTGTSVATSVNSATISLSCTGSASAADQSAQNAAATAANKAKYCPGGSAPDPAMCALYSGTGGTQSSVQGAENIVNEIVRRGIVK